MHIFHFYQNSENVAHKELNNFIPFLDMHTFY